jgi:Spy/CpxP family protein refolding chaperone
MTRRAYLYFIVTILLGAFLGGAGVYYFLWYNGRLQRHEPPRNQVERLKKVLNLSDAQAQQVGQIFNEGAQEMRDLTKKLDPQYQAIHEETRVRIRQILNPDQAQKFDEFVRQIDERRRRRSPPPPPPAH